MDPDEAGLSRATMSQPPKLHIGHGKWKGTFEFYYTTELCIWKISILYSLLIIDTPFASR